MTCPLVDRIGEDLLYSIGLPTHPSVQSWSRLGTGMAMSSISRTALCLSRRLDTSHETMSLLWGASAVQVQASPAPGGASTHLDTFVLGVDERPQFAYFEPNCSFEVADVPMMVFGADRTRAPECWNQLLVQHRTAAPSGVRPRPRSRRPRQCPACRGTCGRDWQTRRGSRCCGRSR